MIDFAERRAITRFVDWMYDVGPDPNAVTRRLLLHEYAEWRKSVDATPAMERTAVLDLHYEAHPVRQDGRELEPELPQGA